jgi:hypothetical protein
MPETAPPGRSYKERWPDDARSAEWMLGSSATWVLGSLAGVFALPPLLGMTFAAYPLVPVVIAVAAVAAVPLGRRSGRAGTLGRGIFRLGLFLVIVGLAGIALSLLASGLLSLACGPEACRGSSSGSQPMDLRVVSLQVLAVAGSLAIGITAAFAVSRLATRYASPPVVIDPATEAWWQRHRPARREQGR